MDKFPKDEYYELTQRMEKYHEIFSCLWRLSEPRFSEEVPTAAVAFDSCGACIDFMINQEYWESLDDYSKEFVVCHEMLHVILAHGSRTIPYRDKYTGDVLNAALDLAVNHLLTASFGFNRFYIKDWEKLCWADTILKDLDLDPNKSFEYYIDKVKENLTKINVDVNIISHEHLESFTEKAQNVIRDSANAISGRLSKDEQAEQNKQILSELQGGMSKGETGMFSLFSGKDIVVRKIKKWETVIDKYIRKSEKEREFTQWVRANRRLAFIDSKLLLPSDAEVIDRDFYKYNIWLFLDYSGSCSHLKDIFFKASNTFDPRRFNVKKFAHTTEVGEFIGDTCKVYGGGTNFSCIENYIQSQIRAEKLKAYPDAVFHFTDGYGYNFSNPHPERWHVFLTDNGTKTYHPAKTNFFYLKDYVEDYNEGRYW